ncbi:MAG: tryptophan synthase subunit alpha, partial [Halanaerobiales bacterium]
MEKISNAFSKGKALITYISAGDPDLEMTKKIIFSLDRAGVDIIELGIPFSDPLADGPVIQAAGQRALEKGATLSLILETVKEIRPLIQAPVVLMGYYNNILSYGQERFIQDVKKAGVNGLIVPDLPYDEEPEFYELLNEYGLAGILLVAPNTSEERLQEIGRRSTGFLYCVSLLGVTG